jgi:hypothetical protein
MTLKLVKMVPYQDKNKIDVTIVTNSKAECCVDPIEYIARKNAVK